MGKTARLDLIKGAASKAIASFSGSKNLKKGSKKHFSSKGY